MFGPRTLLDRGVQEARIVLSTLLGMAVDFVWRWIEGVEFFRYELPFVARFGVLSEWDELYCSSCNKMRSSS